jgi:hypothetical protein
VEIKTFSDGAKHRGEIYVTSEVCVIYDGQMPIGYLREMRDHNGWDRKDWVWRLFFGRAQKSGRFTGSKAAASGLLRAEFRRATAKPKNPK